MEVMIIRLIFQISQVDVSAQVDHLPSGQDGAGALRSLGICGGGQGREVQRLVGVPGDGLGFLRQNLGR